MLFLLLKIRNLLEGRVTIKYRWSRLFSNWFAVVLHSVHETLLYLISLLRVVLCQVEFRCKQMVFFNTVAKSRRTFVASLVAILGYVIETSTVNDQDMILKPSFYQVRSLKELLLLLYFLFYCLFAVQYIFVVGLVSCAACLTLLTIFIIYSQFVLSPLKLSDMLKRVEFNPFVDFIDMIE